jgi:uncharacterized protein YaiE (UPF0345 family)
MVHITTAGFFFTADREWSEMNKRILGAFITIVLGAGLIAGIGLYVASAKNDSSFIEPTAAGTLATPQGTLKHYTMDLSVYPDSLWKKKSAHPDWVSYGPSTNFHVPSHSAITITIKQYDSGEQITNDFFAKIHGTLDGTAIIDGQKVTQIDPKTVGHTFTIRGLANKSSSNFFVSVPLPAGPDDKMSENEGEYINPRVVTFTIITGDAGEYAWNCEFPCGDGTLARFGAAMSTQGFMSGHFIVEDK